MKRKSECTWILIAGGALAFALYALTLPTGMPWGKVETLSGAWVWTAMAAGVLGAFVARYFGWRVGAAAALVWTFLPPVWDRAILGSRSIALVSFAICGGWVLDAILSAISRKLSKKEAKPQRRGNNVGWILLAAAGMFAIVSLTLHDYRLGEAASAFARGVVEEAGKRIVVLNGVVDEQLAREVGGKGEEAGTWDCFLVVSLREDDAYRANLVAWAKREWPGETNLHLAGQVSVSAFLDAATRSHPDRFYVMNGASTTVTGWERRWTAFAPYLRSSDPFVPVARRLFAYEGNAAANRLSDDKAAYALYKRIYDEVDPGNVSALVNMSEMIRGGFAASGDERRRVGERIAAFFRQEFNRRHIREIVQICGPVRTDPEQAAKTAAAGERILEQLDAGEKVELPAEVKSMFEQSDTMVRLMMSGDCKTAAKIARHILSQPAWRTWVPANAVMGETLAAEGDYVGAEAFFRTAIVNCDRMPAMVVNNYADVLMQLGKLDEAERVLRALITKGEDSLYGARLTLAEVLTRKIKGRGPGQKQLEQEVRALTAAVAKNAPDELKRVLDEKLRSGEVLK